MRKTLGGSIFIRNGVRFDYCFQESINCLLEFCDKVAVIDAGSDDEKTVDILRSMEDNPKLRIEYLKPKQWEEQHGREKLAYFTDRAIELLDTDYNFYLQADEILHEKSYPWVRTAMELGKEGYLVSRINLWGSPYTMLNVPQSRLPCSNVVLRLAKTCYRSYGDAESLRAPAIDNFVDDIRIYHMGFTRKRSVMKAKIDNMVIDVFNLPHDVKLDLEDEFNPKYWFSIDDLAPIKEPLPSIITDWALERSKDYENVYLT